MVFGFGRKSHVHENPLDHIGQVVVIPEHKVIRVKLRDLEPQDKSYASDSKKVMDALLEEVGLKAGTLVPRLAEIQFNFIGSDAATFNQFAGKIREVSMRNDWRGKLDPRQEALLAHADFGSLENKIREMNGRKVVSFELRIRPTVKTMGENAEHELASTISLLLKDRLPDASTALDASSGETILRIYLPLAKAEGKEESVQKQIAGILGFNTGLHGFSG
jgi:hypothetical protein